MVVILAIDALEYDKVIEFNCKNLKQEFYGKTDISEFSEPRTMVLWSSFITGANKEREVLKDGNKEMWNKRWNINETFFYFYNNPVILDLPGFSYELDSHERSRKLLKQFFEAKERDEKERIRKKYNHDALGHHKKIKGNFLRALNGAFDGDCNILLGYFSAIDAIGHLNFGNKAMMKILYDEMDDIAGEIRKKSDTKLIVLSDHGMKVIGIFGEHSNYGFWSTNFKDIGTPKITDFYELLVRSK